LSSEQMRRYGNPMLRPRIEKVVINSSVGRSGEPLEKAMRILEELTGQSTSRSPRGGWDG